MDEVSTVLKAKPVAGGLLGVVAGLAIAVVLQQQGVWPLDRILVFLLPALVGLLGIFLASLGRVSAPGGLITMLVILVAMGAWGATGLAQANQNGELNGGCTVVASSPIDSTVVTDTSRGDPFSLDPDGGVTWFGSSPTVFRDFEWEVWVDVGGFPVTIDSGFSENSEESTTTDGSISSVSEYGDSRGIPTDQLRGVFVVGGFAATCDGFAFLEIVSDFLETMVAKVAAAVALLAILALAALAMRGRGSDSPTAETATDEPKSPF